ncbi:NAD(P)-binding protein [Artomyces pyxidatus]|uniref:NAD(P)-binding protein n=1 Tax=Artomyces pyxidatus TaxID=48021 RepID=A0ACB8SVW9_9AGAM|nr:NAD(P)-binding protein [Artomyces pyxidatus]
MAKTHIFLTGATGYIGGTVLQRLLDHTERASFEITVLVRQPAKAVKLASLGLQAMVGSLDDVPLVRELASNADVVINNANSDDLLGIEAILSGLKLRFEQTKVAPILIHTSGTGVFVNLENDKKIDPRTVYYDSDADQMESLPTTRVHRLVDLEVVRADKEGYVRTFIVLPGAVYGLASGPLVDLGVQNMHTYVTPHVIRSSIHRGQTPVAINPSVVWPCVEIGEVGDLYRILFDAARKDPSTPHGREGYYVGENGEMKMGDIRRELAGVLYWMGQGKSPEPEEMTDAEREQALKSPTARFVGSNCRAVGERSRALGWKPTKTAEDMIASIMPEVLSVLDEHVKAH